jgi:hypothetical protein
MVIHLLLLLYVLLQVLTFLMWRFLNDYTTMDVDPFGWCSDWNFEISCFKICRATLKTYQD